MPGVNAASFGFLTEDSFFYLPGLSDELFPQRVSENRVVPFVNLSQEKSKCFLGCGYRSLFISTVKFQREGAGRGGIFQAGKFLGATLFAYHKFVRFVHEA